MDATAKRKWLEARGRMRRRVDAVFWQELGISSPERDRYVDWVLDQIFRQEYLAALGDDWTVWREDENGGYVPVEENLSYVRAQSLLEELNSSGASARYWYAPPHKPKAAD